MIEISVIVPTLDEEATIERTLRAVLARRDEARIELFVADGGSRDRTVSLAEPYATVVRAERGRARQLNAAARTSRGEVLFFLHADVDLPPGALNEIRRLVLAEGYDGGGFSNVFSRHNERIKRLGHPVRCFDNDHAGNLTFYGDNGIFVRRRVFEELGGFRDLAIMEDYEFSRRLRRGYRSVRILTPRLIVSPRRHERTGFLRTRLLWIVIYLLYRAGCPTRYLAALYSNVR